MGIIASKRYDTPTEILSRIATGVFTSGGLIGSRATTTDGISLTGTGRRLVGAVYSNYLNTTDTIASELNVPTGALLLKTRVTMSARCTYYNVMDYGTVEFTWRWKDPIDNSTDSVSIPPQDVPGLTSYTTYDSGWKTLAFNNTTDCLIVSGSTQSSFRLVIDTANNASAGMTMELDWFEFHIEYEEPIAWQAGVLKYYNGATWLTGILKRWNGSSWVPGILKTHS